MTVTKIKLYSVNMTVKTMTIAFNQIIRCDHVRINKKGINNVKNKENE